VPAWHAAARRGGRGAGARAARSVAEGSAVIRHLLALLAMVLAAMPVAAQHRNPVGVREIEYVEPKEQRTMWMAVFYPAAAPGTSMLRLPFTVNVTLYADAAILPGRAKRPLVMLSHGRGSDAWQYAWFAQALASRGYIVAALNHYRANSYDREIG